MKNCPFSMASWTMNYLELIFLAAIIFPIVGRASGAGECRKYVGARKLYCYDCDSRYDPYCADPFNKTLPPENRPATRVCHGCCVKFVHKFSDEEYIQRSCTESIIINYFMVDHVCMGEGKGHGKMCFCEDNLCNDPDVTPWCYDCDSRFDPYCADPFNKTLPPENKPAIRMCRGCCIKFLHKIPNGTGGVEEYVQRSCTENIIINYFMVDHVCMGEGKGRGKMCFCENDFCNDAPSLPCWASSPWTALLLSLTSVLIMKLTTVSIQ